MATIIRTGGGDADLSVVTAGAADVLAGKVIVGANGNALNGTISSKSAATITPGTTDQTIAAGQYLSGIQTILGDPELTAANIKKDINIFGKVGSLGSVKSIQRGYAGLTTPASNYNPTINAVDVTKSIVLLSFIPSISQQIYGVFRASLLNSTTVSIEASTDDTGKGVVAWQVIEFENVKSLQSGLTVVSGAAGSTKNITISAVDLSKSIIVSTASTFESSSSFFIYAFIEAHLSAATTITTTKGGDAAYKLQWYVIEFN